VQAASRFAAPNRRDGLNINYLYTFDRDGSFLLDIDGIPLSEDMPIFPRIGVQLNIPECMDKVQWFGLGPGEAYSDTCTAQRVGLYKTCVDNLYTKYTFPQENGNRHLVRRAAFYDLHSAGLLVAGCPLMDFSAHRFTPQDFDEAKHPYELKERENIILNIDWKQAGIGSGSCGPKTADKYQIPAKPFRFAIRFRPMLPGELNDNSFFRM